MSNISHFYCPSNTILFSKPRFLISLKDNYRVYLYIFNIPQIKNSSQPLLPWLQIWFIVLNDSSLFNEGIDWSNYNKSFNQFQEKNMGTANRWIWLLLPVHYGNRFFLRCGRQGRSGQPAERGYPYRSRAGCTGPSGHFLRFLLSSRASAATGSSKWRNRFLLYVWNFHGSCRPSWEFLWSVHPVQWPE